MKIGQRFSEGRERPIHSLFAASFAVSLIFAAWITVENLRISWHSPIDIWFFILAAASWVVAFVVVMLGCFLIGFPVLKIAQGVGLQDNLVAAVVGGAFTGLFAAIIFILIGGGRLWPTLVSLAAFSGAIGGGIFWSLSRNFSAND